MQSGVSSCSGEFIEQAREAQYRAERLPEYIRQARLSFRYAIFLNLVFLFSDWRFFGHPHFYFAISARGVIVGVSLVCLAVVAKVSSFRHLQFVCVAWFCPVIAAGAVLVFPGTDIALLATFILPVIFYLIFPVSFRLALAFGAGSSAATLAAYMSPSAFGRNSLGLLAGMLMSNVVLILVLSQSNRLRRLEWAAAQSERVANAELAEHRDSLRKMLKAIPAPLIITAKNSGKLIQANDAARDYFGADLLRDPFRIESHIDHRHWPALALKLRAEGQASGFETRIYFPDDSVRDVLLEATTVGVAGQEAILMILVDITSRKEVEATMKLLATTDSLSGLPNRARFFTAASEEINRAARYKRPLALFMIDIDFFKRINDTHGHEVGDLALRAFAELCRNMIRHEDIVARLGGEEFGILLPETSTSSALALAERLRAAVESLTIDRLPTPMTISIGVSEVLAGEAIVDPALARADLALYAAKKAGRNRVVSYGALNVIPAVSAATALYD
ncbi:MAG TPA: diguanylate cyclase [Clostridia bacterium]|nr:diguanylate cyclase [Clostridia bacterium]